MNNSKFIPTIISLGLLLASSGCITTSDVNDDTENKIITYVFEIHGDISIVEPYSTILPIPLNITMDPMFSEDELLIEKGNISFNYTETKYGLGIKVNTSEDFILKAETTNQAFSYFSLSVKNLTKNISSYPDLNYYGEHLFWLYSNFTSNDNYLNVIIIAYEKNNRINVDTGRIVGEITGDWQKIDGAYTKLVT